MSKSAEEARSGAARPETVGLPSRRDIKALGKLSRICAKRDPQAEVGKAHCSCRRSGMSPVMKEWSSGRHQEACCMSWLVGETSSLDIGSSRDESMVSGAETFKFLPEALGMPSSKTSGTEAFLAGRRLSSLFREDVSPARERGPLEITMPRSPAPNGTLLYGPGGIRENSRGSIPCHPRFETVFRLDLARSVVRSSHQTTVAMRKDFEKAPKRS